MNKRLVIPELLDHLPATDPEALRSRRDLRRINFLMGNERWICRSLRQFPEALSRGVVEIGAGDGLLCAKLARIFSQTQLVGYDLLARPENLSPQIDWQQGDIFKIPPPPASGVMVANLLLHHFATESLPALGCWFGNFEVLIFNEPDRARIPHLLGHLLHPWINRVTRHDLHASITAGFSVGEIPHLLESIPGNWQFEETSTWRGARRVIGWRT